MPPPPAEQAPPDVPKPQCNPQPGGPGGPDSAPDVPMPMPEEGMAALDMPLPGLAEPPLPVAVPLPALMPPLAAPMLPPVPPPPAPLAAPWAKAGAAIHKAKAEASRIVRIEETSRHRRPGVARGLPAEREARAGGLGGPPPAAGPGWWWRPPPDPPPTPHWRPTGARRHRPQTATVAGTTVRWVCGTSSVSRHPSRARPARMKKIVLSP